MGRLIKEALFQNELVEEHYLRSIRDVEGLPEENEDAINPESRWIKLANRIREIDPYGIKSQQLNRLVEIKR